MHLVRKALYVRGYTLLVTFDNGEERLIDLSPHLTGEVFQPLRDTDYFRRFRVHPDLDTTVWPNDADFSPDFLYEIGTPVTDQLSAADK